jgi:predicted acylesterase/phospholipase RssA
MVFKYLAISLLISSAEAAKSCRALAMSGGGSKGSYEIGGLWGLVKNDPNPEKYAWDVVTGVSAGSLNTAIVTGFAPGDENKMVEYASELFQNTDSPDAYKMWPWGGIIRGITDKSGFLDNSPAYSLVTRIVNELGTCKRKFAVSSVDVNTGTYVAMNETLPRSEHARAFMASTLIPAVFPSDKWGDNLLMDGGTVWNTNLVSAIKRCREQVDDDSEITLDIVVCGSNSLDSNWQNKQDTINNYLRYKDINEYHKGAADIVEFMRAYPKVNFRHYLQPSQPLASGLGILNFNNVTSTFPMQMIGRIDGENAVK